MLLLKTFFFNFSTLRWTESRVEVKSKIIGGEVTTIVIFLIYILTINLERNEHLRYGGTGCLKLFFCSLFLIVL